MTRPTLLLALLVLTTQALAPAPAFPATSRSADAAEFRDAPSVESRAAVAAENSDALEDAFFDLMWLCDSPVETERDAAQEELTRRFDEFELVWKDRTFLTDGEVADESRLRFERAEKDFWTARRERARNSFDVETTVAPPEGESVAPTEGEGTATTRRANVRVSWRVPLRVVWLAPDLRSFLWRDPETNRLWRPRSLYSAPELQPVFGADQVEFELFLEPVPDDASQTELAPASTLAFDALVGVDPVPISIPLFDVAEPREPRSDEPREYRVGELTLRVFPVERDEKGGRTVVLRLDYDSAFDAFDSHRTWREPDDFLLAIQGVSAPVRPAAIRVRDRNQSGERLELFFPADPALDKAFRQNAAALLCRLPRFFIRLQISQ